MAGPNPLGEAPKQPSPTTLIWFELMLASEARAGLCQAAYLLSLALL